MPGNSGSKGRGGGAGGRGRAWGTGGPGRSASSPGHLKREAGATSARDYAPGRAGQNRGIDGVEPDRADDAPRGLGGLLSRLLRRG